MVIAELGINHQGDFQTLIDLTDMAFSAGVDFVKLQMRTPELCVPLDQWDKPKMAPWGEEMSYIDYRRKMEFSDDELYAYGAYVRDFYGPKRWSASVWDIESLNKLMRVLPAAPFIKIPSAKITDIDLLNACVRTGKHVIASTGMSDIAQISSALQMLKHARRLTLLSCNSSYPTKDEDVNLLAMRTLAELAWYNGAECDIGFSSHSTSPFIPIYAMLLGAACVEVHVTLDRTMLGSDHAASQERHGLELICREAKRIPTLLGNGEIEITESELVPMRKLRG